MELSEEYQQAWSAAGVATLTALGGLEGAARFLHPPEMPRLREWFRPYREELARAGRAYSEMSPPPPLAAFHESFAEGITLTERALDLFLSTSNQQQAFLDVLAGLRTYCRALEVFYGLHRFPPLSRYFVEPPFHDHLRELDPKPPEGVTVGLHHGGGERGPDTRGGFCLYIPESYDGEAHLPLVVALHGGYGSGRDFLWSWLREARGRRFLLLAPTSRASTWQLSNPANDSHALRATIEFVASRWNVDRSHILLTGLSDGATYALLEGLSEGAPYTHLAPVSGVLHPDNLTNGNLERARGRKIYLVHGMLDWMFPVQTAEMARDKLLEAGAQLECRLLADLSHTYPREENDRVLAWFDPRLALPAAQPPQ